MNSHHGDIGDVGKHLVAVEHTIERSLCSSGGAAQPPASRRTVDELLRQRLVVRSISSMPWPSGSDAARSQAGRVDRLAVQKPS